MSTIAPVVLGGMSTSVVFGNTLKQVKNAIFRPVKKRLNPDKYVESLFAAPEGTELFSKQRRASVEALLFHAKKQPNAYSCVKASSASGGFA